MLYACFIPCTAPICTARKLLETENHTGNGREAYHYFYGHTHMQEVKHRTPTGKLQLAEHTCNSIGNIQLSTEGHSWLYLHCIFNPPHLLVLKTLYDDPEFQRGTDKKD